MADGAASSSHLNFIMKLRQVIGDLPRKWLGVDGRYYFGWFNKSRWLHLSFIRLLPAVPVPSPFFCDDMGISWRRGKGWGGGSRLLFLIAGEILEVHTWDCVTLSLILHRINQSFCSPFYITYHHIYMNFFFWLTYKLLLWILSSTMQLSFTATLLITSQQLLSTSCLILISSSGETDDVTWIIEAF